MGGLHDIKRKDWERLLKNNGFYLDRTGKHNVWKHPDGRVIPTACEINPCIARRMIKENHLEGAPFGWSKIADNQEKKAKEAEAKQTQWQEQLQQAKAKLQEQKQQQQEEEQKQAQQLREQAEAERKRQEQAEAEQREIEIKKALDEAEHARMDELSRKKPSPTKAPVIANNESLTQKIFYMNENRLKKFHNYLCAVVEYYQQNNSLKNFSSLAKQFQVKAITLEQFYQSKLNELKPGEKPDRKTSDRIRMMMAEDDLKRRQQMLDTFLKTQEKRETDGHTSKQEEVKEPTLSERIDTFEARFDLLGPVFADITSHVYNHFEKEFGQSHDLLGIDTFSVRLSPQPYLIDWANNIEFDLTRLVFDNADPEEVRQLLPSWNEKILHAYLTWLYGGNDGTQLKLDFDERGREDSSNDQLIELLRDQHLLDDMLFVKMESWKGCALCAAIYKDAPDVLMIIDESNPNYYTIEDNIWSSFQGNTIIQPENNLGFSGWGTRTIIGHCLRQIINPDNHKEALAEQQHVTKQMRGKLMDDINNYRAIWQMYHEDYKANLPKSIIDFG